MGNWNQYWWFSSSKAVFKQSFIKIFYLLSKIMVDTDLALILTRESENSQMWRWCVSLSPLLTAVWSRASSTDATSCANQLPQQHFLNNRSSRPFLPVKPREMNPTIYINAGDEGDTDDRGGRGWWGFQSSWRAPGFRPIIPHPKSPAREIPCQKLFSVCWDFSGLKTSSCLSIWEGRTIPKCKSLLDAKALFQISFFSFKYLIIEEISR